MSVQFVIDYIALSLLTDAYVVHKTGVSPAPYANVEFTREESTMFQHNQRLLIDYVLDSTRHDSVVAHYLRNVKNSTVGWWITSKYQTIYLCGFILLNSSINISALSTHRARQSMEYIHGICKYVLAWNLFQLGRLSRDQGCGFVDSSFCYTASYSSILHQHKERRYELHPWQLCCDDKINNGCGHRISWTLVKVLPEVFLRLVRNNSWWRRQCRYQKCQWMTYWWPWAG